MSFETRLDLIHSVLMAGFMALMMSGALSCINAGFCDRLFWLWGRSFLIAWPLAFALSVVFGKAIRQLSKQLAVRFGEESK